MPQVWTEIGAIDPNDLLEARLQAHHAAQWATRAARANLAPQADDSHTNLGWDAKLGALMSHEIGAANGNSLRLGLRIGLLTIVVMKGNATLDSLALDGKRDAEVAAWIDALAASSGLRAPSQAILPYALPVHPVAAGGRYSWAPHQAEFAELARWYEAADDMLQETRTRIAPTSASASPVRCWPHHFDIATLLTLGSGNPETTPSIGIGMSPGDDYYAQPYFYVSPWPRPPTAALPVLPAPGHWHMRDFVGAIATAEAVLALDDRRNGTGAFIDAAIAASRRLVGAS